MIVRRLSVITLVSLAVAGATGVAVGAISETGPFDHHVKLSLNSPPDIAHGTSGVLRAHFSVLNRPRTSDDELPPAAARVLGRAQARLFGANATLARRVVSAYGKSIYVAPSADGLCIADETGAGGCDS